VDTFALIHKKIRLRWPEWCALSVYAALVAMAIPYHEPWADEAQAWQLARSLFLAAHSAVRCNGEKEYAAVLL
jgi:hypothetical protein